MDRKMKKKKDNVEKMGMIARTAARGANEDNEEETRRIERTVTGAERKT